MAFDETWQRILTVEKAPQVINGVVQLDKRGRPLHEHRLYSEFAHSMVATTQLHVGSWDDPHDYSVGGSWSTEETIIPPIMVADTSNASVGAALFHSMGKYVSVGQSLASFILFLARFEMACIILNCDQASSNYVLIAKFATYVNSVLAAAGVELLFSVAIFVNFCGLHRLSRALVKTTKKSGL